MKWPCFLCPIQRLLDSLKTGAPPTPDDDCLSVATGDTDLRSPSMLRQSLPTAMMTRQSPVIGQMSRQTPPTTQRAPLLQYSPEMSCKSGSPEACSAFYAANVTSHGDKYRYEDLDNLGLMTPPQPRNSAGAGYGTLQVQQQPKATLEVIVRSTSQGGIARVWRHNKSAHSKQSPKQKVLKTMEPTFRGQVYVRRFHALMTFIYHISAGVNVLLIAIYIVYVIISVQESSFSFKIGL